MVNNMLGKLKIRCVYEKNGCKEILLLDNLENHEKTCCYDKKTCEKCFCDLSSDHDCVKSLLDSKQELTKSNEELEKELKFATEKISSMKSEIENYLQTIQELKNSNKKEEKPCDTKEVFFLRIGN
jgi:chromosome segregation ATPase